MRVFESTYNGKRYRIKFANGQTEAYDEPIDSDKDPIKWTLAEVLLEAEAKRRSDDYWREVTPEADPRDATIAELRARVAELEGDRNSFAVEFAGLSYDSLMTVIFAQRNAVRQYERELRDQMTKAWMRNDLTTADRIADLINEKRPSEHEAADSKAEVQA